MIQQCTYFYGLSSHSKRKRILMCPIKSPNNKLENQKKKIHIQSTYLNKSFNGSNERRIGNWIFSFVSISLPLPPLFLFSNLNFLSSCLYFKKWLCPHIGRIIDSNNNRWSIDKQQMSLHEPHELDKMELTHHTNRFII